MFTKGVFTGQYNGSIDIALEIASWHRVETKAWPVDTFGVCMHGFVTATSGCVKFTFPCGLRGFHEYRSVWTPTIDDELTATHESSNRFDRYAIAAFKMLPGTIRPSVVGHLPREISRFTYYVIVHGG